jgi:hypothetical protein
MTQVFIIPEHLQEKYHGDGPAIAAINTQSKMADFYYIKDLFPEAPKEIEKIIPILDDGYPPEIEKIFTDLSRKGQLLLGEFSQGGFFVKSEHQNFY